MKTKEEIEILRADALAGDAEAQAKLGFLYCSGDGVTEDYKEAFKWFSLSSKQGDKSGQYGLALQYHYGVGVKKDIRKAIDLYKKSALQNHKEAENKLEDIFESGFLKNKPDRAFNFDIEANREEAFHWWLFRFHKFIYDKRAKYNLAKCYELGIGTSISLYRACDLYKAAEEKEKWEEKRKKYDSFFESRLDAIDKEAIIRLKSIRSTYSPLLDSRLESIDIIGNNPFRVLGVYNNATEREIRANKNKIDVAAKVGKYFTFDTDHIIPCNIEDNVAVLHNNIEYGHKTLGDIRNSEQGNVSLITALLQGHGEAENKTKETICEWESIKKTNPNWAIMPNRSFENLELAINRISSDRERIKYALFWFCKHTSSDEKALQLLSEHKYDEAKHIWEKEDSFSAYLNRAILNWIERKDERAIADILKLIHSENCRSEFISTVTSGRFELSKEELSQIFFEALYDFPDKELSIIDIHYIIMLPKDNSLKDILNSNEYLRELNLNKQFEILKDPLDNLILNAEKQNPKDWEKCSSAYYNAAHITKKTINNLQRFLGENNLHYKLYCNETALKFLNFAIRYNNDNKEDWNAPSTAYYFADLAQSIAVDETLRERCHKNVEIFDNNKRIVQTQKACECIDNMFEELEGEQVSLFQVEKKLRSFFLHLEIIESNAGKNSEVYKIESDGIVNKILNIVIKIYNKDKDPQIAASAEKILKELQKVAMKPETQNRLNQNIEILSKNKKYTSYSVNSDYRNTENRISARKTLKDINKRFQHVYRHTYTPDEIKYRRLHKSIVTVVSVIVIALILSILFWVYNEQWFFITGIVIISFIVLFLIIMWILELLPDPHKPDFEWFEDTNIELDRIANEITYAGARGGRTYSWPFAIPFQLLAILIGLIGLIINGLAKLAAKIR